jgi:hypothetical protein
MARNIAANQSQRSLANPLVLGTFSSTSLKYLKGTLKSEKKIVDGGYGGGTYNNWFQVNTTAPSWIIITKGPPRPNYIQTSAYDLNHIPIQGESIFDEDSVRDGLKRDGEVYIPYLGSVMSAQSDLYNNFEAGRLDRGDERYYPLAAGSYLICVSSTRNEPLDYEVGVVIEFPVTELFAGLEDTDEVGLFLQETAIDFTRTINVSSNITVNTIISSAPATPNGFTELICVINSSFTVTVLNGSTWFIGETIPSSQADDFKILLEPGNDESFDAFHDHSLSEWKDIWDTQHQNTDPFPTIFTALTNRL